MSVACYIELRGLPYMEKMAINLQVLIFSLYFFIFSTVHSNKICPYSFCGKNYFPIMYPFKLQGQNPEVCIDYTDVRCSSQDNKTILNLPFSGDFYVHDIDYNTKELSLSDPGNCLVKRLINLNLSSSPFEAIIYETYTFYSCPITKNLYYSFKPIDCLSNSPNATVATALVTRQEMKLHYNCSSIFSSEIPVSWYGEYENMGNLNNIELTWNAPYCKECDEYDPPETGGSRSKWSKIIRSPLFIPIVVISTFLCVVCFLSLMKLTIRATVDNSTLILRPQSMAVTTVTPPETTNINTDATPSQRTIVTIAIDDMKMKFCTELAGPNVVVCAICLEEYHCEETIRYITQCGHYFHSDCIDQWLQNNLSCPVCRTSLSHVN